MIVEDNQKKCVVIIKKNQTSKEGYIFARDAGFLPAFSWIVRSDKEAQNLKKYYPDCKIIEAP